MEPPPISDKDLKFQAAFDTADEDTREAPWYGVWNLVLGNIVFQDFCADLTGNRTRTTVTYPQHPLLRGVDTNEDDDFDVDEPRTPTPPAIRRQSSAPSPPDLFPHGRETSIDIMDYSSPSTPPRPPLGSKALASSSPEHSPISSDHSQTPSSPPKYKRSTRIPDFAEILHEYLRGRLQRKYLLLLVENKPKPSLMKLHSVRGEQRVSFVQVLSQTREQAIHALQSRDNAHIKIIGVIVALGQYWQYVEYHRDELIMPTVQQDQRSWSARTYDKEKEGSVIRESHTEYEPVTALYEEDLQCCVLQTDRSDEALLAVRKRMLELAAMY